MRWSARLLRCEGAALVFGLMLCGCATIIRGRTQEVRVDAPAGTLVRDNGMSAGHAPCVLTLTREQDHFITWRTEGQSPQSYQVRHREDWTGILLTDILPAIVIGALGAADPYPEYRTRWSAFGNLTCAFLLVYSLPSFLIDRMTGAGYVLSPTDLPPLGPKSADAGHVDRRERLTLAVLPFMPINVTPADADVITEMIRNRFVEGTTFRVVERSNMNAILAEQAFQQTGVTSVESAVALGRILNVAIIATGSFGRLADVYYVNLRLVRVDTGEVVFAGKASGKDMPELEAGGDVIKADIRKAFRGE